MWKPAQMLLQHASLRRSICHAKNLKTLLSGKSRGSQDASWTWWHLQEMNRHHHPLGDQMTFHNGVYVEVQ